MSFQLAAVKASLAEAFDEAMAPLLERAENGDLTVRSAETEVWNALLPMGRALLTNALGLLCKATSELHAAAKGWSLGPSGARFRRDKDYFAHLQTTFGPVAIPLFAMRTPSTGSTTTPARALFHHYPKIRSSELLIEWECALAADHPFRKAADALIFFSHGATALEDTTIERHAVAIGNAVPVNWLYRAPNEIRKMLLERAVCDTKTQRPILYASTDAHALKRFVDKRWNPKWKMLNGIRVWAVDKKTGKTIHIGGEFTWGDCMEVRRCFERLQRDGILPADGDFGEGVVAQIALLTDGMEWISDYVLSLFPDAVLALDPYHVLQHVADAAKTSISGKKALKVMKEVMERGRKALGIRNRRSRTVFRKGPNRTRYKTRKTGFDGSGQRLLDAVLRPLLEGATRGKDRIQRAIGYVERNLHRLNYGDLRCRGFQIGSGAMESMHRTGSQVRLKRAGCHWTAEAAQGILNLRMLQMSGRWQEYWNEEVLPHLRPLGLAS